MFLTQLCLAMRVWTSWRVKCSYQQNLCAPFYRLSQPTEQNVTWVPFFFFFNLFLWDLPLLFSTAPPRAANINDNKYDNKYGEDFEVLSYYGNGVQTHRTPSCFSFWIASVSSSKLFVCTACGLRGVCTKSIPLSMELVHCLDSSGLTEQPSDPSSSMNSSFPY